MPVGTASAAVANWASGKAWRYSPSGVCRELMRGPREAYQFRSYAEAQRTQRSISAHSAPLRETVLVRSPESRQRFLAAVINGPERVERHYAQEFARFFRYTGENQLRPLLF